VEEEGGRSGAQADAEDRAPKTGRAKAREGKGEREAEETH